MSLASMNYLERRAEPFSQKQNNGGRQFLICLNKQRALCRKLMKDSEKAGLSLSKLSQALCLALMGASIVILAACTNTTETVKNDQPYQSERLGGNELLVRPANPNASLGVYNYTVTDTAVGAQAPAPASSPESADTASNAQQSSAAEGSNEVTVLAAKCRSGDGSSCESMAKQALQDYDTKGNVEDLKSAIMLATKACAYKQSACMLKGDLFYRAYKDKLDIDSFLPGHYVREEITSAYTQATDAGDLTLAAEAYYKLGEINTEFKRTKAAQENFAMSCKVGGSEYCVRSSQALKASGQTKQANEALEKACNLGDNKACLDYGEQLYAQGAVAHANKLYQQACNAKDATACRILGQRYSKAKSMKKAQEAWDQGCALGDGMSCSLVAGYEVRSGQLALAAKNFAQGCTLGNATACHFSASYELNQGKVDTAMTKLGTACSTKDAQACYTLGLLQEKASAQKSFDQACKLDHKQACNSLADSYAASNSDAIAAYEKACSLGDASSCLQWGMALASSKQSSDALKALTKACDLKNPSACERLGMLYSHSDHATEAVQSYRKACNLNAAGGCMQLALSYSDGKGVKKSNAQSMTYFSKACKLGSADACAVTK